MALTERGFAGEEIGELRQALGGAEDDRAT
jgi:hypothetical protein